MTRITMLLLMLCIAFPLSHQFGLEEQFQLWMSENGKAYKKAGELQARAKIFSDNARLVEEHNSKESSFKVGGYE